MRILTFNVQNNYPKIARTSTIIEDKNESKIINIQNQKFLCTKLNPSNSCYLKCILEFDNE